ncbi:hypothetical protein ACFU99_34740 [Streptomyces sp. NPDC057654]|uniref:hypothetical protein n=1 Tax=Streptomyces sp. NPDC057654 TaxID=3346196 RepID=UPI003692CB1F
MDTSPQDTCPDARSIGVKLAEELHLSFLALGFCLPIQGAAPVGGRAFVSVDPIGHDTAFRLIETLGPPPLRTALSGDCVGQAADAARSLRRSLFTAGLALPGLRAEGPLVELGTVSPSWAESLAEVVASGAKAATR